MATTLELILPKKNPPGSLASGLVTYDPNREGNHADSVHRSLMQAPLTHHSPTVRYENQKKTTDTPFPDCRPWKGKKTTLTEPPQNSRDKGGQNKIGVVARKTILDGIQQTGERKHCKVRALTN
jgi:hypothetical protein